MKAFLASLVVFVVLAAATAWMFEDWVSVTATEAYSRESARPGHDEAVHMRPGMAPGVEEDDPVPAE